MDFNAMLEEHIKHETDITATLPVNAKVLLNLGVLKKRIQKVV
jgi:ADP-glucose pyrophosphorylase